MHETDTDWDLGLNEVGDYLWLSGARQPYEYNPFVSSRRLLRQRVSTHSGSE